MGNSIIELIERLKGERETENTYDNMRNTIDKQIIEYTNLIKEKKPV